MLLWYYVRVTTKICPRCKVAKPLSEFHKNKNTRLGVQVYCRECKAKWQHANLDTLNGYHRKYRAGDKYRAWFADYNEKNGVRRRDQGKTRRVKQRAELFEHYGDSCQCCGESVAVFLAIDHINGGGTKERREFGRASGQLYYWLRKNNWPAGFQTLCHNCNWAKHALGRCPHQGARTTTPSSPSSAKCRQASISSDSSPPT